MSRMGEDYEIARHDGRGRLIVEVFGCGEVESIERAQTAFRKYFREGPSAHFAMRALAPDRLDPQLRTFEYLGGGTFVE